VHLPGRDSERRPISLFLIDGLHFIVSPVTVGNVLGPVFGFEDGWQGEPRLFALPLSRAPGQLLGPDFFFGPPGRLTYEDRGAIL
jgi:hypothetical protein